jgi:hypothetical protein
MTTIFMTISFSDPAELSAGGFRFGFACSTAGGRPCGKGWMRAVYSGAHWSRRFLGRCCPCSSLWQGWRHIDGTHRPEAKFLAGIAGSTAIESMRVFSEGARMSFSETDVRCD